MVLRSVLPEKSACLPHRTLQFHSSITTVACCSIKQVLPGRWYSYSTANVKTRRSKFIWIIALSNKDWRRHSFWMVCCLAKVKKKVWKVIYRFLVHLFQNIQRCYLLERVNAASVVSNWNRHRWSALPCISWLWPYQHQFASRKPCEDHAGAITIRIKSWTKTLITTKLFSTLNVRKSSPIDNSTKHLHFCAEKKNNNQGQSEQWTRYNSKDVGHCHVSYLEPYLAICMA